MVVRLKQEVSAQDQLEETKACAEPGEVDEPEVVEQSTFDSSLFFYKVAECYILGYRPDVSIENPLSK